MTKRQLNPWEWQDRLGYSQGWRIDGAQSIVLVAGQGPASADGALVGDGDFDAQVRQAFANLSTVLEQAGASLDDVAKLTVYLTDIGRLRDYGRIRAELMPGAAPASTAIEVGALAWPGMMVEIEAVAVL
jgi:2-iminobutanoate/2-iminopropanoate deaminase